MKKNNKIEAVQHATLDLKGANCTSCSIAIEHIGRRMDGIAHIRVDRAHSAVYVTYNGDIAVLDKLCDFVRQIGYSATIRSTNDQEVSANQGDNAATVR